MNKALSALACSGSGAMTTIYENLAIGYFCAAAGVVVTLALVYDLVRTRRVRFTLPAAAVLLLVHPAWTVSAFRGDCGYFKRDCSLAFTAAYIALLIWQYAISKRTA